MPHEVFQVEFNFSITDPVIPKDWLQKRRADAKEAGVTFSTRGVRRQRVARECPHAFMFQSCGSGGAALLEDTIRDLCKYKKEAQGMLAPGFDFSKMAHYRYDRLLQGCFTFDDPQKPEGAGPKSAGAPPPAGAPHSAKWRCPHHSFLQPGENCEYCQVHAAEAAAAAGASARSIAIPPSAPAGASPGTAYPPLEIKEAGTRPKSAGASASPGSVIPSEESVGARASSDVALACPRKVKSARIGRTEAEASPKSAGALESSKQVAPNRLNMIRSRGTVDDARAATATRPALPKVLQQQMESSKLGALYRVNMSGSRGTVDHACAALSYSDALNSLIACGEVALKRISESRKNSCD